MLETMENSEKSGATSKEIMSSTQGVLSVSEKELHKKFTKLGADRRRLTNQLVAMLPEIYERGIYKKYAATIVEYAGKFGGLSKSVVMKRLRIEKYLEGKPKLKNLIVSEGVHKVALVASLATSADEAVWADKVENMSKEALFELAKEVRCKRDVVGEGSGNGLFAEEDLRLRVGDDLVTSNQKCQAAPQSMKITLEGELFFLFHKLKKQLGKHLTSTELLHKIFTESLEAKLNVPNLHSRKKALDKPISRQEDVPGNTFLQVAGEAKTKITRYNPVAIVREKLVETGGKCSYPGCQRPHDVNHHAQRYAEMVRKGLSREELKKSLRPMCKAHHEFAHNGLINNELEERCTWELDLSRKELIWVDENYRKWRKEAFGIR